ncbi:ComEA family DNA-binding protein [Geothrix fermentans]|uniref:ComEA family DNA-binding protein n=1 Tax=Geothrix fermentans TaxID=44676 RepID=UPI00041D9F9F|nr:helix-hairpin-helix domain-containing protein [Geothrix fermentans]
MKNPLLTMTLALSALLAPAVPARAQEADVPRKAESKAKSPKPGRSKAAAAKAKARAKAKAESDAKAVDINSATKDQLKTLPGITDAYADKIIAGRPYKSKAFLVTNNVIPESLFQTLRTRIVARQAGVKVPTK